MENNIESNFVPYELALELKELGFDEPCFAYLKPNVLTYEITIGEFDESEYHSAPLYQQAFRWFREKYDLHAEVKVEDCVKLGEEKYYWNIFGVYESIEGTPWIRCLEDSNGVKSNNYKEAETACLLELINICKK